jgi:dipeptidyl aminopeptidase/acylaminoacyl peptidase
VVHSLWAICANRPQSEVEMSTGKQDIRDTPLYQEAETLYRRLNQPGSGLLSDATDVCVSPDGSHVLLTGSFPPDILEGTPSTRICLVEIASGDTRVLTFGPNTDRLPRYSPDGRCVAFLSDRSGAGDFQLYLLDLKSGAVRGAPRVDGWVEYFQWAPDGTQIVLGVAGHGADVAGSQGAITTKSRAATTQPWMPVVQTGEENFRWRRAWIYDPAEGRARPVGDASINTWEAVWCGNDALVVVASPQPDEAQWYSAHLSKVDIRTSQSREIYVPKYQLGCPTACPSGAYISVIEALCSDRGLVAGTPVVIHSTSGRAERVDTHGVDITYAEWRTDRHLLVAGHRGFETVLGLFDTASGAYEDVWASSQMSTGGRYVTVSGFGEAGDCALIAESFLQAPELAVIRSGTYHTVRRFLSPQSEDWLPAIQIEKLVWKAPDGIEIQGWLLRPPGGTPRATILDIHGGPVWAWRPRWLGRSALQTLMLLEHGYAVLLPNPRGSTGRGHEYVRHVLGDMGGADTHDYLSGIDFLVQQGISDPTRIGVTGGSYGGFMTAWLITQDARFAAAIAVAPFTNHVTEHLVSNLPHFVSLFLQDDYTNVSGKYYQRSPVMFAHKANTPTLNICGALDRATPPEEAAQFHSALRLNGCRSVLVTYPDEGHGIRKLPASLDYSARVVAWFEEFMPARPAQRPLTGPIATADSA